MSPFQTPSSATYDQTTRGRGTHDTERLEQDITTAYTHQLLYAHKQTRALILMSFLVTFATIRFITHAIRAGRWHTVLHNV